MGPVTKLLLVLALVVPVGAYVAGSLAAPGRDEPADRGPVILRDAPASPTEGSKPAAPGPARDRDDDRDGRDDRDDEARVVKPQPTPVVEDDDDGGDDDGPDDDTETERDDDRDDD